MKESEENRLKCVVYESTRAPLTRSPFPNGEGCDTRIPLFSTQRLSQGGRQKGSQPRHATLGSPIQGKGLAWSLPPSYGRRCPEGAEVGWGKRCEKERGRSSQVRRLRKHPIHRCAVPLPQGGRLNRQRLRREYIWGDARRSQDKRIPVLNFPSIAHLPANDKHFSLRLK